MVIILNLFHPIVWLVGHVWSDKAEFSFFAKENRFFMLFQTSTKLTFGLSDVFVVTVIARNTINGVGSLVFPDRILRFGKNMPQSLKRFFCNFNVKAVQNSLDEFRNTMNVRNNRKTSRCFTFIRRLLVVTGNWQLRRKAFVQPFAFKTSETYFLFSAFESSVKTVFVLMLFFDIRKVCRTKISTAKKNYFFVSFNNDRGLSLDDKTKDYVGGSTFVT